MPTSLQDRLRGYAGSNTNGGPRREKMRCDLRLAADRLDRLEFALANLRTIVLKDQRVVLVPDVPEAVEGG